VRGERGKCVRRSRHRVDCELAFSYRVRQTTDFYVCSTTAIMRFRSARSHRLRVGITDPSCEQV
jgi:hypothetical protein